mgnify:CR=1 FL=1
MAVLKCVSVCNRGFLVRIRSRWEVCPLPTRLKNARRKLVGTKSTLRALKEEQVMVCYLARDAEAKVLEPVRRHCAEKDLEIVYVESMKQLGRYCGIEVGAAVAAILK